MDSSEEERGSINEDLSDVGEHLADPEAFRLAEIMFNGNQDENEEELDDDGMDDAIPILHQFFEATSHGANNFLMANEYQDLSDMFDRSHSANRFQLANEFRDLSGIFDRDDDEDDDDDELENDDDDEYDEDSWMIDYDEDMRELFDSTVNSDSTPPPTNDLNKIKFDNLINQQKENIKSILNSDKLNRNEHWVQWDRYKLSDIHNIHSKLLLRKQVFKPELLEISMAKSLIPNSKGMVIKTYPSKVYSGQFSIDGSFFYKCSQDFKVSLYNVEKDKFKLKKEVRAGVAEWTITDSTLSNDNKFLAYSSITPIAYLIRTEPNDNEQIPLSFFHRSNFGIWSLRFSNDGKELIAGTSNHSIMILDVETDRVIFDQLGHEDDVNAVCFSDQTSNVLFSGSDDGFIKVWDRRSMYGNNCTPAGILLGHTSGITYVSAKGDGRYCISNAKDQTMKLWDIRKLTSTNVDLSTRLHRRKDFDYRMNEYPYKYPLTNDIDGSIMTYTGHKVLNTLIRCHFSPAATTGQQYVYTGSADGKVYIYHLDGTLIQTLHPTKATTTQDQGDIPDPNRPNTPPPITPSRPGRNSGFYRFRDQLRYERCVVRDVAWHPNQPYLIASCWAGDSGRLVKHTFTTKRTEQY